MTSAWRNSLVEDLGSLIKGSSAVPCMDYCLGNWISLSSGEPYSTVKRLWFLDGEALNLSTPVVQHPSWEPRRAWCGSIEWVPWFKVEND